MPLDVSPRDPWVRVLVVLLVIIAALHLGQLVWGFVAHVGDLILLFVMAWIISFVLEPTVATLSTISWMTRTLAVLAVYGTVLLAITAGVIIVLPVVADQSALAAEAAPRFVNHVAGLGSGFSVFLASHDIHLGNYTDEVLRPIEAALLASGLSLATSAASVVAQVLLVVVLSIYFMLDGDHLGSLLMTAVPARYRDDFIYLSRSLHQSFGGFLRGQVIQALIYGIGVAIIMTATGLPFTALSSVVAGFAMFIPIFGPPLGIAPPLLVIVTTDVWRWWVLIPIVLLNTAVVNIVAPKVMGQQIGLHPTIVLAAVLVGARVAGPWGAVFGAPVVAVIANMIAFYRMSLSERSQQVRAVTGEPDPDTVTEQPIVTAEEIAAVVDGRRTDG